NFINGVVSTSTSSGGSWLNISPSGNTNFGTSRQDFTVSVNQAGLPVGSYQGSINIFANNITSTIPVTLNVPTSGSGGGSGNVSVSPTSVRFSYQLGSSTTPPIQGLQINSSSSSANIGLNVTTSTTSGGNWLSTNFISGAQTPLPLTVSVNTTGLTAGTYQ